MTDTTIWVTTRRAGWHHWPDAPPARSYLADEHRHLFHLKATIPVGHDNRDVEFHDLLDDVEAWWPDDGRLGARSCEAVAREIGTRIMCVHQPAWVEVDVAEDGECGATVRLTR